MLFGKYINRYYARYWYLLLIGVITLFVVDVTQLQIPVLIGNIINGLNAYLPDADIDTPKLTLELLSKYIFAFMVIGAVMFFGRFLWRVTIFNMGVRVQADLRDEMFAHSIQLSKEYYSTHKTGEELALYTNDAPVIRQTFASGTIMVCDALFLGVYAFYNMLMMDKLLTLLSALPLVLMSGIMVVVGRSMKKRSLARQEAFAEMSDFVTEDITGITVIKAFVREGKELLRFNLVNKKNKEKNLSVVRYSTTLWTLLGLFLNSVLVVAIIYVSYVKSHNISNITVGDLIKFIAYFDSLIWPMMAIANIINIHSQGKASLQRIQEMMNQPIDIKVENPTPVDIKGNIRFNHYSFKYPGNEKYALEDITLDIKQGEKVGIIGRTGCGKTTLVDTLLHNYNIDSDMVYIDGVDLMKIDVPNLRNAVAYVPQDNFLFSDTIENNICFSIPENDLEKAKKYAEYAAVAKDIEDFPDKYQTILGERGVTLSGGQRQRVSIARAMIKEAPILIMDDSVSAVDTETEEKILQYVHEVRKDKTTLIVAHRISTVKDLDKIVIMENGKIIGVGTHLELLQNSKVYQEMVLLQQLDEEEGGEFDE